MNFYSMFIVIKTFYLCSSLVSIHLIIVNFTVSSFISNFLLSMFHNNKVPKNTPDLQPPIPPSLTPISSSFLIIKFRKKKRAIFTSYPQVFWAKIIIKFRKNSYLFPVKFPCYFPDNSTVFLSGQISLIPLIYWSFALRSNGRFPGFIPCLVHIFERKKTSTFVFFNLCTGFIFWTILLCSELYY